jgi:SulP family sulfate permease
VTSMRTVDVVRAAGATWWRSVRPRGRRALRADALAGVPRAIASVPDGMAASVLAGVNPVHGLYASFAGPIAGGLTSSTRLMVVTTTSAAALAAGSALQDVPAKDRPDALFLMTVAAGVAMILAGVFRLGRYTRFVSHSVMTGFLTGVAVNIILSQLGDLTGTVGTGEVAIAKALDILSSPSSFDGATMLVGAAAIVVVIVTSRGPVAPYAAIFAVVIPTVLVIAFDAETVRRVSDVGDIPGGLPVPALPKLSALSLSVVTGALAVAAIVLVQGAGVAESAPNPDGERARTNRDFVAQGAGNVAAGFFQGQPVGGSVGQTALNRSSGAVDRWAAIFSGLWMLAIIALFSGVVEKVAMATLAAVLVVAAVKSIRVGQIGTVWRAGNTSKIALGSTFVATLLLPIAAAVGVGVAISLLLQMNSELMDLRLVRLVRRPDGRVEERPAPAHLEDRSICVLDAYGSLLYSGARTLQARLPDPAGAQQPVVVLRLRGRVSLGATFVVVLEDYADRIRAAGGHLVLSGVDPAAAALIAQAGGRRLAAKIEVVTATSVIGESTEAAYRLGQAWLSDQDRGDG